MIELGKTQELELVRTKEFGVYLSEKVGDEAAVLLPKKQVPDGAKIGDKVKVFIPGAAGSGRDSKVLGKPELAPSHSVCSQSYLYVEFGDGKNPEHKTKAQNFIKYLHTKFVRVLVSAVKISQACPNRCYQFVPIQDFSSKSEIDWSKSVDEIDEFLFKKFNFSKDDIEYTKASISKL